MLLISLANGIFYQREPQGKVRTTRDYEEGGNRRENGRNIGEKKGERRIEGGSIFGVALSWYK